MHSGEVVMAQFSGDGRKVVTASQDHTARIWDAQTGQPLAEPLVHLDHVKWVEFSSDGNRVVTASTDNTACLWDARTGRKLVTMQHGRIVERAVFSPDGRRVATSSLDRTALIWDANTGQALTPTMRHEVPVSQVGFSADARRLFTSSWNGSARLWDSDTGRPVTEWLDVKGPCGVTFEPVNRRIILGATNGIGRVWHIAEAPVPVPGWFITFAETVAGIRLGDRGQVELVPEREFEPVVHAVPAKEKSDFYGRLAQWFLANPPEREPAPF
jgi:WD40 repeat protein